MVTRPEGALPENPRQRWRSSSVFFWQDRRLTHVPWSPELVVQEPERPVRLHIADDAVELHAAESDAVLSLRSAICP